MEVGELDVHWEVKDYQQSAVSWRLTDLVPGQAMKVAGHGCRPHTACAFEIWGCSDHGVHGALHAQLACIN